MKKSKAIQRKNKAAASQQRPNPAHQEDFFSLLRKASQDRQANGKK